MDDNDIKKIGEEFERVLEPVYEDLDGIKGELDGIKNSLKVVNKTLEEHSDKIDALTSEVHDIHLEIGAERDKTKSEIEKIKELTGLRRAA